MDCSVFSETTARWTCLNVRTKPSSKTVFRFSVFFSPSMFELVCLYVNVIFILFSFNLTLKE